jgi:heme exporter protein A
VLAPLTEGAISARAIGKSFGGSPVLESVSFEAQPGDLVTVAGANGAGKTTLLRIIAGLVTPDAGSVSLGSEGRTRAGWAPAGDRAVHWRLSARQNLGFIARLAHRRTDLRVVIDEAIDALSIRSFDSLPLGTCSTGQRRRVMLAQAFLAGRPVVVLDEPFADLDAQGIDDVVRLIRSWRDGGGIVVVAAPQRADMPPGSVDVDLDGSG